ncbi:glycoside hydrolase family 2 TIM barrel-domain containing protein [Ruthenibacterium lactatiformans]|jgi:beta-galactosidase|uniref:glycoside hydrolase family 2 TIM barrel-domain containing protein n=1 Tax=Ruthenibacterium lactatiformans TaxID=1550024 RepID=UPI000E7546CB|nr:glycoside hydrolase family 2 TIM barrel-domain containing protein [Ruthenibacterium lactatiformans]RJW28135.1 DUF4982 domain-containing protein [Subdoligranulum sp. TF05-17AC]
MNSNPFNQNWKFRKQGSEETQTVTLPHDAMIHERREPNGAGGSAHGFFPGGIYVYEKNFTAPAEWADKTVFIEFEGVYRNSVVSINGKSVGGRAYGYVPFRICADALLNYGGENTITVTVDNSQLPNSRWYTGSGIYRPVNLIVGNKTHIEWQGVRVSTISYQPARIKVETESNGGEAVVEILDGDKVVASGQGASLELDIPDAKLWSDETPYLYTCHVTLAEHGQVVDEVTQRFGIRKVEWNSKGLFINGKETLLRGGCYHHDNGILGAATFDKSEERRVRIMKEAGFNALRSSHNPTSRAMLEACDKYGMYLMDETWDMWYSHKNKFDYASNFEKNWREDIRSMIERDFNHPSVILYSIGNEVSEPAQEKGVQLAKEMVEYIHSLDRNRAVTGGINLMIISRSAKGKGIYREDGGRDDSGKQNAMGGMNSTMFNMITSMVGPGMNKGANGKKADAVTSPVLDALDIAGYNYASGRYPLEGKAHPDRVIFGSETFPQDIYKNWQMVKKYPYLVGDFMWTAWDYLGEAGIGAWSYTPDGKAFDKPYPWLLADVGALDLLGNPNGELFLAQAAWGLLKKPAIAVQPVNHPGIKPAKSVWRGTNALPSWSWQGCEGNKAIVEVYADATTVELLLNGKSLGKKKIKDCKAIFKTKYAPGTLTAVAYDAGGQELSRNELKSAIGSIRLVAEPEETAVKAGDIVYIPISLVGQNGVLERNADCKLTAAVENGELLAFGSANPRTEERYDSGNFTTYYGCAMAIVRAGQAGTVTLSVKNENQTATAAIEVK